MHVRGVVDVESGMVINMTDLKQVLAQVEKALDHKNLDRDVAWFRDSGKVSTTENLCICIWEMIQEASSLIGTMLHKVVVNETENNRFSYKGECKKK